MKPWINDVTNDNTNSSISCSSSLCSRRWWFEEWNEWKCQMSNVNIVNSKHYEKGEGMTGLLYTCCNIQVSTMFVIILRHMGGGSRERNVFLILRGIVKQIQKNFLVLRNSGSDWPNKWTASSNVKFHSTVWNRKNICFAREKQFLSR